MSDEMKEMAQMVHDQCIEESGAAEREQFFFNAELGIFAQVIFFKCTCSLNKMQSVKGFVRNIF